MAKIKYRALREGKMTPRPGGPVVRVREGEVLILTDEQFAANRTLFVRVNAPKDDDKPVIDADAAKATPAPDPAPFKPVAPSARVSAAHEAPSATRGQRRK